MKKHIDAHCHVFTKDILSTGIRIILGALDIGQIAKILDITHLNKLIKKLEHVINFIDIGMNNDTEGIYEEMQKVYNNEFIVTPLMLDLTYVSGIIKTNIHKSFKGDENQKIHTHVRNAVNEYTKSAEKQLGNLSASEKTQVENKLKDLKNTMNVLEKKVELFSKENDNLRLFGKRNFQKQFKHLKALKKDNPEMVYPFLSVDPRKKGILDIVKNEVGKGKDFIGIKLYSPCGYSPTDPVLFGTTHRYSPNEDCLYNYCIKNDIPITAHNSDSGFATFTNTANINGYIYNAETDDIEDVKGTVVFKKKIDILKFEFDEGWIEERAMVLNHPKIWNHVLNKFNGLRLNLAHFGGSGQLNSFINSRNGETPEYETYSWAETIFSMLQNPLYKNFYTDLSCFNQTDDIKLSTFKEKLFDTNPDIQNNILYGSDFYLNMIFMDNFNDYLAMFKTAFGSDFEKISVNNNRTFLKFTD
jgi:hypothetical protein